jgi:hypothetical protein
MKESLDNMKVKLPDGAVFNMTIISRGNSKEHPAYIVGILCLINQKGLNVLCKKPAKALEKLAGALENLH